MIEADFKAAVRLPAQQVLIPDFATIEAAGLPAMGGCWCVWRLQHRSGKKPSKLPYDGTKPLDSTRPHQWISYNDAKQTYLAGGWDGVGYLPNEADMVVGLDADGVFNNKGVIGSAERIVKELERIGCYLERSPSGQGLRGFVLGLKDGKAKVTVNGHSVEAYQSSKAEKGNYVSVTGRPWGDVRPIAGLISGAETQKRLEAFLAWAGLLEGGDEGRLKPDSGGYAGVCLNRTDAEVLSLMLSRLNPQGKYSRLMEGEIDTDFSGNASEARFALLTQLAYITRDDEQIERIVRGSKLCAAKFDERRNGCRNFLHYDIMRALKVKDRNFDEDRVGAKACGEQNKLAVKVLEAKAAVLHGGLAGLLGAGGKLQAGSHTLSELLIRDQRLIGVMHFDEFSGLPMKSISFCDAFGDQCAPRAAGQLEDDDLLSVTAWARNEWNFIAEDRANVIAGVRRWARNNPINPITDKLQKFSDDWDGVERLEAWLSDYVGAKADDDNKAYFLAEVGKRFLVGVVARAFVPGTQQDQMLVLEASDGGEGKTAAVRIMGNAIDQSAFLEGFSPANEKDCFLMMRGKLLGEWGELAGFDKRESQWNKDFLTRASDTYRDPYGALHKTWKRTISFIATTNNDDYLKETGGIRRYWPVKVGFVDLVGLKRDMGQLWGEAVRLYQSGYRFWIDKTDVRDARFRAICDREQRGRLVVTAYDDLAKDLAYNIVAGNVTVPDTGMKASSLMGFSVTQMGQMLFKRDYNPQGDGWRKEWLLMVAALKRCGWETRKLSGNNRGWGLSSEASKELFAMVNEGY